MKDLQAYTLHYSLFELQLLDICLESSGKMSVICFSLFNWLLIQQASSFSNTTPYKGKGVLY